MVTTNKKTANIADAYRRYMKLERNFTQNTLDAYMHDIDKLLRFLASACIEPQAAKLDDLRAFAASLHDVGVSPRTQCRILSGVRTFYRFLLIDGYVATLPKTQRSCLSRRRLTAICPKCLPPKR